MHHSLVTDNLKAQRTQSIITTNYTTYQFAKGLCKYSKYGCQGTTKKTPRTEFYLAPTWAQSWPV